MLASQLISAGDIEERHGLEAVAARYLNESVDKTERLSNWNFALSEAQLEYAARDAAILLPLREKLIERLRSDSLVKCAQLEFQCVMPVADIELAGFFMHKDRWLDQLAIVEKRRAELAHELQEVLAEESLQGSLFGGPQRAEINLDSHQQLTQALERLGIPVPDSTRNWKLQPLAAEYPVVAKLQGADDVIKAKLVPLQDVHLTPHTQGSVKSPSFVSSGGNSGTLGGGGGICSPSTRRTTQ